MALPEYERQKITIQVRRRQVSLGWTLNDSLPTAQSVKPAKILIVSLSGAEDEDSRQIEHTMLKVAHKHLEKCLQLRSSVRVSSDRILVRRERKGEYRIELVWIPRGYIVAHKAAIRARPGSRAVNR